MTPGSRVIPISNLLWSLVGRISLCSTSSPPTIPTHHCVWMDREDSSEKETASEAHSVHRCPLGSRCLGVPHTATVQPLTDRHSDGSVSSSFQMLYSFLDAKWLLCGILFLLEASAASPMKRCFIHSELPVPSASSPTTRPGLWRRKREKLAHQGGLLYFACLLS